MEPCDKEAQAIFHCTHGLEPLDKVQRVRVLEYLKKRYEFDCLGAVVDTLTEVVEENKKLQKQLDEVKNGKTTQG